jgi:hypothetical protein
MSGVLGGLDVKKRMTPVSGFRSLGDALGGRRRAGRRRKGNETINSIFTF